MDFKDFSQEVWKLYHKCDWKSDSFCIKKSYICSLLSQLAYEHIPQFELKQNSRIKIIPQESYTLKLRQKQTFNISEVLNNMDFRESFIIESEHIIVIGFTLRDTIFLTIRGTQSLYDALVDLNIRKRSFRYNKHVRFHRGFYNAVEAEYKNIAQNLSKYKNCNMYITGHSLGGAMASILFNQFKFDTKLCSLLKKNNVSLISCYTYGMPRFCSIKVSYELIPTFQIYNTNDVVPLLPPKLFGYNNFKKEYELSQYQIIESLNTERLSLLRFLKLFNGKDIKEHSIEYYSDRLKHLIEHNMR